MASDSSQDMQLIDLDGHPEKTNRARSMMRTFGILLWSVAVVLLVFTAIGFATSNKPITPLGSLGLYYMRSDSMEPDVGYGSLVIATSIADRTAEIGDTILFAPDATGEKDEVVMRRVVNVLLSDNQVSYDTTIRSDEGRSHQQFSSDQALMGLVAYIPYLGLFIDWLTANVWWIVGAFVISLVLVATTRRKEPEELQ
jgi:amino acid transporter